MSDDQADRAELDAVRRLLADARHTEPMPDDVAARLDATLAGLAHADARPDVRGDQEDPSAARRSAEVVALSRHRRRRAGGLILAAAAIVVGGVVVQQLQSGGGSGSSADVVATSGSGIRHEASSAASPSRSDSGSAPSAQRSPSASTTKAGRVVVRPRHFVADAQAAASLLDQNFDGVQGTRVCVSPPSGSTVVPASYQRAPAALVYQRAEGSTQVVDLFLCGHTTPTRSVTLPLP